MPASATAGRAKDPWEEEAKLPLSLKRRYSSKRNAEPQNWLAGSAWRRLKLYREQHASSGLPRR